MKEIWRKGSWSKSVLIMSTGRLTEIASLSQVEGKKEIMKPVKSLFAPSGSDEMGGSLPQIY